MSRTAISPLDGRYAARVETLSPYFAEWALIRARFRVEVAWFVMLSERREFPQVPALSAAEQREGVVFGGSLLTSCDQALHNEVLRLLQAEPVPPGKDNSRNRWA